MQQLNSLEASARAQLNFIEQLTIFHRQQEHSRFQIPKLGGKPVDLWQLRKEVNISGGFDIVSQTGRLPTSSFTCINVYIDDQELTRTHYDDTSTGMQQPSLVTSG